MSRPKFDRKKVWLGITPTLWWNDDFLSIDIGISFGQCVSEMALAGFQGCSVGHKFPTDPAILKRELALRGLRVSEPWVSTYFTVRDMEQNTLDAFHRQMEFIKALGGTDIVLAELGQAVHPLPVAVFANRPVFNDSDWEALTEGLNNIGNIARKNGMRVCYHPHMGTGVMTAPEVDRLMAETDPQCVHLLLDTAHLWFAGANPLEITQKHAGRIKHVHLKDIRPAVVKDVHEKNWSFRDAIEAGVFTVPGDGAIDFVPILARLSEAGYEGWLVVEAEQDPAKANPLEYALKARDYLARVIEWE